MRGAVTGAVAGAGLDICIATGGVGGLVIAVVFGAAAAVGDTIWENHNTDEETSASQVVVSGVVGAGMNVLFGASGRVVKRAVGNTIGTVFEAMWKNTVKSFTSRARRFMMDRFVKATAENLAYSTTQGTFAKAFTEVLNYMVEQVR